MREISPPPPCVLISGLKVNRDRVVNTCFGRLYLSAPAAISTVLGCGLHRHDKHGGWRRTIGVFQSRCQQSPGRNSGLGSTGFRPLLDITHLHTQDSALDTFHAKVISLEHVMIFLLCAPIPQHPDLFCVARIVGRHHAGFAICSQIFAGIETKAGHVTEAANAAFVVFRAMRLRRVFNHDQVVPPRNFDDCIHVCRQTVQMNRNHGSRFWGDRRLSLVGFIVNVWGSMST